MVEATHFDRVTAERDALQALLTAADERADVLEGLLRKAHPFTNDVAHDVDVWLEIDAALKPAEGGGDEA
ncbi:hypothetical protein [Pseudomonas sp. ICMP 8385]|uniref:hypothetical protein n=1 Tax=Pseudomonas sp. ICMP 8385 TaxID=1718920 RepID=UPI001145ED7D|nr:hypothetical protein [Pseudomonas sp. ICMP 8385]